MNNKYIKLINTFFKSKNNKYMKINIKSLIELNCRL